MDFDKLKAPFPQEQVSWRAQTVTKDGNKALALAYIDARDVANRLDEVCGPANWQNRYSHADKKTVCEIGIKIDNEWIWKADGAGDSDVEAEKGSLSDSFKRAAVRWQIGRYLYDLDTPWVPCESRDAGGKKQFVKFTDNPWNHVRKSGAPKPPAPPPPPVTASPEALAKNWVAEAKTAVKALKSSEEVSKWVAANHDRIIRLGKYPEIDADLTQFLNDQANAKPSVYQAA